MVVRGLVAVVGAYAAGEGEQRRWRGGKDELGCDDVWRPSDQQLDEFKQMREEEQRVN